MSELENRLETRLCETLDLLWDRLVDPLDAVTDADGVPWPMLGAGYGPTEIAPPQLDEIRRCCRQLAMTNEFAINGHENRINYIVGLGHRYRVVARVPSADNNPDRPTDTVLIAAVQEVIDRFLTVNRWSQRQQEIIRRKDRDGECFIRLFTGADSTVRVRFVEPEQVATPDSLAGRPNISHGIVTERQDVETVEGYYIDGRLVPADRIQHRKQGVDGNVRRGIPLFYPVIKNLRRAERLLRNMSVLTEIQSSIAIIRKHRGASRSDIEQFVSDGADATATDATTGQQYFARRYAPGTILDAAEGTDYQFPAAAVNASQYVTILQAELRAVAARLVMPEFMLSSNASNANYASTMVAEGPAVKMFERLQDQLRREDLELLARVIDASIEADQLPADTHHRVRIDVTLPNLSTRDRLREAQADQILVRNGAMTPEIMAARHGIGG